MQEDIHSERGREEGYDPLHSYKIWTDFQIQNPLIKKGTDSLEENPAVSKGKYMVKIP